MSIQDLKQDQEALDTLIHGIVIFMAYAIDYIRVIRARDMLNMFDPNATDPKSKCVHKILQALAEYIIEANDV